MKIKVTLGIILISVILAWNILFTSKNISYNIVFITVDTLRADRLGCYGYPQAGTPNIDKLANNGILFTKTYSTSPLTFPSHSSIMTGTNPTWHGIRDNSFFSFPQHIPTLASILQEYGYYTAATVSSATLARSKGLYKGFCEYDDVPSNASTVGESHTVAERIGEDSIQISLQQLKRCLDMPRPFLLWLHLFDPHAEYSPPSPFREKYSKDLYQGEISYTDYCLGKLFQELDLHPEKKSNTIIVLTADHGEGLGEHGELSHGYFLYNTTLHIPWIIAGSMLPKGHIITNSCSSVDILPTILSLLGIQNHGHSQGQDLSKKIFSKENLQQHDEQNSEFFNTPASYAETYYTYHAFGWRILRSLIVGHYKYHDTKHGALYNLESDPTEKQNLLNSRQDLSMLVKQFQQRLSTYQTNLSSSYNNMESMQNLADMQGLGYISSYIEHDNFPIVSNESNNLLPEPTEMVDIISLFIRAQTNLAKNQDEEAIKIFNQILKKDPKNLQSWVLLGKCYVRQNQLELAQKTYLNLLEIRPTWMTTKKALLDVEMQRQDYAIAQRIIDEIIKIEGEKDAMVLSRQAYLKILSQNFVEASRIAQKATIQDPKLPSAWFYWGISLNNLKDYAKAIPIWREAIRLRNNWPEAYYHYGQALSQQQSINQAREAYQRALEQLLHTDPLYNEIQKELQKK